MYLSLENSCMVSMCFRTLRRPRAISVPSSGIPPYLITRKYTVASEDIAFFWSHTPILTIAPHKRSHPLNTDSRSLWVYAVFFSVLTLRATLSTTRYKGVSSISIVLLSSLHNQSRSSRPLRRCTRVWIKLAGQFVCASNWDLNLILNFWSSTITANKF